MNKTSKALMLLYFVVALNSLTLIMHILAIHSLKAQAEVIDDRIEIEETVTGLMLKSHADMLELVARHEYRLLELEEKLSAKAINARF